MIYDLETQKPRVAKLLPPEVAAILVNAAELAREFPPDSIRRKAVIDDAIDRVKELAPSNFTHTYAARPHRWPYR